MGRVIKRTDLDETTIKEAQEPVRRVPVIGRQVHEARTEAHGIREQAEEQAAQLLVDAQAQAEALMQSVREEARAAGYEEGKRQGAEEVAAILASLCQRQIDIEDDVIPQVRTLVMTIVRKILGQEMQERPELVADLVRQALAEKARQRREIFLRVHPDDYQIMKESKPALLEVLGRAKDIAIREDNQVHRHGVIIETEAGIIDAQIESQLAIFEKALDNA